MSAPINEAHIALLDRVSVALSRYAQTSAAQAIADSEARAVGLHAHVAAQLAAVLTECGAPEFANSEHALQWAKGIAQLRAEVERITEDNTQLHASFVHHQALAERAEAELKRYKDAVDAQPWASDAPIRVLLDQITSELLATRNLLIADTEVQAELAAARARLDYIDSLSPGDAWGIYRSGPLQNANLHAGDPRTLRKLPGHPRRHRRSDEGGRMSTPTPRTDKTSESLLSKTFLTSYVTMQELARTLERELITERARLDYMSNCGFEHLHNETGDHLGHEWTISGYGESRDVTLRDVIDAAMKEGDK